MLWSRRRDCGRIFYCKSAPLNTRAAAVGELGHRGVILEQTASIFRTPEGQPFHLYQHQVEVLERAVRRESYVVTSGTGSGKSLTYFLPIIDDLLRAVLTTIAQKSGSPSPRPFRASSR